MRQLSEWMFMRSVRQNVTRQFRGEWTLRGPESGTNRRGEGFGWCAIGLFIGGHRQAASQFGGGGVSQSVAHYDIERLD